ncbi:LysR family transcriptional regulator [Paenibacillus daejeonensis]|uniref:LysR family transcriptional regulator n=1 Tax=Paenibacillus daejeonensis TaxID=135193 RepID=UPI000375C574|nr:LysR family transcriptional regulator [Paenibacillus daejeonensis]
MINLEWYRIFLHTARTGNLTHAAKELYVTQPSVSYAIKQLEAELGVTLFHRLSKGVELTEEGKALLGFVEESLAVLDAGETRIAAMKRLGGGELRIGASQSLIKHVLLPHLNTFHEEYPDIRIRLSPGKTNIILQRIREGQLDCGLVHLPAAGEGLTIHPLGELQDGFFAGAPFRHLAERTLSTQELSELPLLSFSEDSSTRIFAEQWFAAEHSAFEPDIELGSVELLAEFASEGFGIALLTRAFVQKELAAGRLFELQTERPVPPRAIGLALHHERKLSLAARPFVDRLLENAP